MNRLKTERDESEGRLAAIKENDKIITLHPAAIDRYRRDLERPASLLPRPDLGDGDELGESVRRLIGCDRARAAEQRKARGGDQGPA